MGIWMPRMDFRWVIKLKDGEVIIVPRYDVKRTIDRRGDHLPSMIVYEVRMPSGVIRKVWLDEVQDVQQEPL